MYTDKASVDAAEQILRKELLGVPARLPLCRRHKRTHFARTVIERISYRCVVCDLQNLIKSIYLRRLCVVTGFNACAELGQLGLTDLNIDLPTAWSNALDRAVSCCILVLAVLSWGCYQREAQRDEVRESQNIQECVSFILLIEPISHTCVKMWVWNTLILFRKMLKDQNNF